MSVNTDAVLRKALTDYANAIADCPARKRNLGDAPCPSCKAGPRDGCGKDASASHQFIRTMRAAADEAAAATASVPA